MIGGITLAGLPPLAAFWSKDEILAGGSIPEPDHIRLADHVAAFFTAFYVGRQLLMIFFGEPRTEAAAHAVENPPVMTVPADHPGRAVAFRRVAEPAGPVHAHLLAGALHPGAAPRRIQYPGGSHFHSAGPGALAVAYLLYSRRYREYLKLPKVRTPVDPLSGGGPFFKVMANKFYVDELYQAVIVNPYIQTSRFLAEVIDWRFWHDWFHDRVIVGGFNRLSYFLANPSTWVSSMEPPTGWRVSTRRCGCPAQDPDRLRAHYACPCSWAWSLSWILDYPLSSL
jgi:NADH-quinone oxidoreductase subunit L